MYLKFLPLGYAGILALSIEGMEKCLKKKSMEELGYVENHKFVIDSLEDAFVESHTLVIY